MRLKDIIKASTLCIIGTVEGPKSVDKIATILQMNLDIVNTFESRVHFHLNVSESEEAVKAVPLYKQAIGEYFTEPNITVHPENKKWMFGTIDLDEACLKGCKTKWLWKSTDDVLLRMELLHKQVSDADFYYLPGFSHESIVNAGGVKALVEGYEDFYFTPQSNFFILNTEAINTTLYGTDVEEKRQAYLQYKEIHPQLKPWDMKFPDGVKFDCESMLGVSTKNTSKESLVDINKLANFVHINKVADPSHKQIYFEEIGVCHYHHWESGIVYLI